MVRLEILVVLVMRLQILWCKSFGILQWHYLLSRRMKKPGGCMLWNFIVYTFWFAHRCVLILSVKFSDASLKFASEATDMGRSPRYPLSSVPNAFAFKIQDRKGRMHRFTCGMLLFLHLMLGINHKGFLVRPVALHLVLIATNCVPSDTLSSDWLINIRSKDKNILFDLGLRKFF